jgi:CBS domain-containing protein
MLVSQILKSKPEEGVISIKPGSTVAAAAQLLSQRRIGAVIVAEDSRRPLGIVSERDIVRELGKRGATCLAEPVESLMTAKLVTCSLDDTVEQVATQMTNGRFRHLPVMQGAEMLGLISIGDVVKARLSELDMEREALTGMIIGH